MAIVKKLSSGSEIAALSLAMTDEETVASGDGVGLMNLDFKYTT
jgi:hypothetical protein